MDAANRARWKLPQVRDDLIGHLEAGAYHATAAKAVGISPRRLTEWLRQGREALDRLEDRETLDEDGETYATFARDADQAIARAELALMEKVREAPAGKWTAFMTLMERRWPERWSLSQRLVVENESSGPDAAEVLGASNPAELAAIADAL